jgi:hypothetical protein
MGAYPVRAEWWHWPGADTLMVRATTTKATTKSKSGQTKATTTKK